MQNNELSCIHTHTNFCDGNDDIESCCLSAYRKGFKSLGFSAHAPITLKTGIKSEWNLPDNRFEEYLDAIRDAKKRWEGRLEIYSGLELDYIRGLIGPADSEYRSMGLDFIIGAVHFVIPPRGDLFTVDHKPEIVEQNIKECFNGDAMGMVEAYLDAMEEMISLGGFDVLAHPDLIKKNNLTEDGQDDRIFSEQNDYYCKRIKRIAELIGSAKGSPVIEVNTGGMTRGRTREPYPSLPFLKLILEQGVKAVINSDAHRAEDLGNFYDEACRAMLDAGYTETIVFNGRLNGEAVWKSVRL
ncbi:MAG: histidinol-phosphatase [Treponema sp.]|nr:histidinol-phosphatase [Treponema sp.]